MSGGYSTSFDAENDVVLNSHILAEFRKELKSKMRFKTASTYKKPLTEARRANIITFKKSKNICQSLPWSSKKYGNRSGAAVEKKVKSV